MNRAAGRLGLQKDALKFSEILARPAVHGPYDWRLFFFFIAVSYARVLCLVILT